MAAVKAAGPGAAASFFCAARLHGFGFMKALPEISIKRGAFYRPSGITVHTSTDLDRCEIVERDGIPTTDVARTLLDIGGALRHKQTFARTVKHARRLEKTTWHDLIVCLATHARRGRKGITRMRELIEVGMADDELTDTDSELIAVTLIREHGFPEPVLQHRIHANDGRLIAEMDIAYVDRRLDFEIDGDVHLDPAQKAKDDARDAEVRERYGWTVRRIWWEIPVRQPAEFIRIIRQYLSPDEPV
jgi:very-short-patch-repair endonuclease